jgi:hypothetical protein
VANLFTSQTPAIADASDGTPGITTGTTMVFAEDGTVTGVRFYATSTVSGTYTAGLWTVDSSDAGTGTLLASKTMGGAPTGGTWNTVTFDTPVSVTTGVAYRVGIFSGAGRYVATVAFAEFAGGSGGLTNGDIFAPPNNDNPVGAIVIKQGVFLIDAAFGYPTGGSGGTCYFVDVEYTAGASTPVAVDDSGAAVSSLLAAAAAPASDAGSSTEAIAAAAALTLGDTAAASDVAAILAAAGLADGGTSDQALTVAVMAALADTGLAVDAGDGEDGSNVQKALTDIGSAIERLRTTTVRPSTGTTVRPFTGITLRP